MQEKRDSIDSTYFDVLGRGIVSPLISSTEHQHKVLPADSFPLSHVSIAGSISRSEGKKPRSKGLGSCCCRKGSASTKLEGPSV